LADTSQPVCISSTEGQCLQSCPYIRAASNKIWRETEFAEPNERDRAWTQTEGPFRAQMTGCPGPSSKPEFKKVPYRLKWLRRMTGMSTHRLVTVTLYECGKDN